MSATATAPLLELAQDVVRRALEAGATDAECTIAEGDEFSASVRMREVENLKEAGSRAAGLRIVVGKRTGSSYTSDLTADGIARMVRSAVDLAEFTTEDPHCGLPDESELGSYSGDLGLYCDDVRTMGTTEKIDRAKAAEAATFAYDPRITNSEGSSFDTNLGRHVFANSRGFAGEYRSSHCSLVAMPLAVEGESMERDYWFTMARSSAGLESPETVGRTAAERAVRRLGSRKVETQKATIVFEPRTARALLGTLFEAISGDSIYRHASFLTGKLGEKIASDKLTIIDDGTIPGLFGSTPFDDEGVPARRTVVVEKGVLRSYLLNTYAARKLGLKTTGSASRGLTGNSGVGHANFYIQQGDRSPSDIIEGIRNGFYVTELMGFGTNIVSGDYSQGATGIWIRDGELAFPVSEVTIAGNLRSMLESIEAIGTDLEFRSSVASPTLAIQEMTVAGR